MTTYSIRTEHLYKYFLKGTPAERCALNNLNFSIRTGSCTLIKGPSGSGKSTLLSVLAGLQKPSSGNYFCLGENLSHYNEHFLTLFRQRHLGVVFQQFNLLENRTVLDNLSVPLIPQSYSFKEISEKCKTAAEKAGIAHKIKDSVNTLSGGEKQRVAIARSIVSDPEILLADEPTSQLDAANAAAILDELAQFPKSGKTLIITSHDLRVAQHPMLNCIIEMKDGEIAMIQE